MGQIFDSIEPALDEALRLPHVAGDLVDKYDIKDAFEIVINASDIEIGKRIIVVSTTSELQALPVSNKVAFCQETNMLYRYKSNISMYLQAYNTVIASNIEGGWIEHDSYNKVMQSSAEIALEHVNQSSAITLTSATNFTAKPDNGANNGHTHVCKIFCNGHIPTFTGFDFLADSSPLDISTIDTSPGYYHTIIFFKLAGINRFIILDKVLSADTTPPTITVSVNNITDSTITFGIASDESADLNWAIYSGGSTDKSRSDIQNGIGAIQFGTQSIVSVNNTVVIASLEANNDYDLWIYAIDAALNESDPYKTTARTSATGLIQLSAPVLANVSVIDTLALSVPIASSSIDANAESVSLFYKRSVDSVFTEVTEIIPSAETYNLVGLDPNTAYDIYLKAIGDGVIYSDSPNSNIVTQTTQNIAPTLDIPYTSTDGITIELPFSRAMADPSSQAGLFTVSGGKTVASAALKSGNSSIIQVTVDTAYIPADLITITIASGLIPADNGLVYGGVTDQTVDNNVVLSEYPTGYVAMHSALDSGIDYVNKTISDLSGNNRHLTLFAETSPAIDGGILANNKPSVLFPVGTAFKFDNFVCNNVSGFAHALVFTIDGNYSLNGFGVSPQNWVGKLNSTKISTGSASPTSTIEPNNGDIVASIVSLEDVAGVKTIRQYLYNLTQNIEIIDSVVSGATFTTITKHFGIGEMLYSGIIHATYRGEQHWQHSMFYERSLSEAEFTQLRDKLIDTYKV